MTRSGTTAYRSVCHGTPPNEPQQEPHDLLGQRRSPRYLAGMPTPDPLDALCADIEVDAESRALADQLYQAALREGQSVDAALSIAATVLRKMRQQWEDAKADDDA